MDIEAVLFDMDGVLVDSEPMHFRTTNEVLGRRGARLDAAAYEAFKGMPEHAFLGHLAARFGLADPIDVLVRERIDASLRALASEPLLPMEGAPECLLGLSAEGYRLALASSATKAQVALVVEKLGMAGLLPTRVSAEDVAQAKPAPDLFLEAARRLDVPACACLVVEDAVLGVEAARAAGMAAIALLAPGQDPAEHVRAGASACLVSLRQLTAEFIERLGAPKN